MLTSSLSSHFKLLRTCEQSLNGGLGEVDALLGNIMIMHCMYNVLEKNKLTVPKESLQRLGYMYMYMYIAGDLWLWLQIL